MEEEDISNYVILKVNARDRDSENSGSVSDNGRVSYHFKIANENVDQTTEFIIDPETGEVRAKIMFDRWEIKFNQAILIHFGLSPILLIAKVCPVWKSISNLDSAECCNVHVFNLTTW